MNNQNHPRKTASTLRDVAEAIALLAKSENLLALINSHAVEPQLLSKAAAGLLIASRLRERKTQEVT